MSLHDDLPEFNLVLILNVAENHGNESEPDHEAGDLQDVARELWGLLNLDQQKQFAESDAIIRIVDWSGDLDELAEARVDLDVSDAAKEAQARLLQAVLSAAENHGQESDPESEVGDLQDIVSECWGFMTGEQKSRAMASTTIADLLAEWGNNVDSVAPSF